MEEQTMREIDRIDAEIKRLQKRIRDLKELKKQREQFIIQRIESYGGLMFVGNKIYRNEQIPKRRRKTKKQKEESLKSSILSKLGMEVPAETLSEIIDSLRGDISEEINKKITIKPG